MENPMIPHINKVVFITCVLVSQICFGSGWTTFTKSDEMTDEKITFASVDNATSSFFIYTQNNGSYIGGFWLIGKGFSQIHYEPKLLKFRVDKNEPYEIAISSWEPRKVYFDLTNYIYLIDELMNGKNLLVQYPTSTTQSKIEKFSLQGSTIALKKALLDYSNKLNDAKNYKAAHDEHEASRIESEKLIREANDEYREKNCPEQWHKHKEEVEKYGPKEFPGCRK